MRWDFFISHAGEDKDDLVRPLAEELASRGLSVWYDEFELRVGDSLRGRIDDGLARSQHGIVVLSHAFFGKSWPESELDGLVALEEHGRRRILPVWHGVRKADVAAKSPTLAGIVAARTDQPIPELVDELLLSITDPSHVGDDELGLREVRLSPPPSQIELHMLPSGAGLVEAMVGQHEGMYDFDAIPDADLRQTVAAQVQDLRDFAEIWADLPLQERERVKEMAVGYVLEMLDNHLIPQIGFYERDLIGSDGDVTPWKGVVLRIAPAEAIADAQKARRAEEEGQP